MYARRRDIGLENIALRHRAILICVTKKFVLFSDLHLDSVFAWMSTNQDAARRRRQALRDTLRRITDKVVETKADALLCGGDLYEHNRFTPDTAAFVRSEFKRIHPIPVYIAPGNHDWNGPGSLYRSVEWSDNVHIFAENRLQPVEIDDGVTLWGAAHLGPANTPGFLNSFCVDRGGLNLALFHGSERGWLTEQGEGKSPHAPFEAQEITRAGIHHAFLGHYHRPKDDPRFTYPGNPDPLSFGEDGERGVVIATISGDGVVHRERLTVAVTEVCDIGLDISGCASQQDVRGQVEERVRDRRGIARVTLSGELDPSVDLRLNDLLSIPTSLDSLTVRARDIQSGYDFEAIKNEPTVRGRFVTDVLAADHISEEERRKVLTTGLRALAGRSDLEVV